MHELSLAESLVDLVEKRVDRPVKTVRLEVGALTCVTPEALISCFEVCVRGTRLEGAILDIVAIPARARCRTCGTESAVDGRIPLCGCGSADLAWVSGTELRVRDVDLA